MKRQSDPTPFGFKGSYRAMITALCARAVFQLPPVPQTQVLSPSPWAGLSGSAPLVSHRQSGEVHTASGAVARYEKPFRCFKFRSPRCFWMQWKIIEIHTDTHFFFVSNIKVHVRRFYWGSFPADVPGISFPSSVLPQCCLALPVTLSHLSVGHTVGPVWLWFKHTFFISPSGWNKTSLSLDASEEHEGYSSAEDPLHSDAEDDAGKKLVNGSLCQVIAENKIPVLFCAGSCWWSSLNVCSFTFLSALHSVLANIQWRPTMRRLAHKSSWWRVGRRWSWSSRRMMDSGEKTAPGTLTGNKSRHSGSSRAFMFAVLQASAQLEHF